MPLIQAWGGERRVPSLDDPGILEDEANAQLLTPQMRVFENALETRTKSKLSKHLYEATNAKISRAFSKYFSI
jgi:hypothetical protein